MKDFYNNPEVDEKTSAAGDIDDLIFSDEEWETSSR